MELYMPNDPQQLDSDAKNLAMAIRQVESGGDPTARGKSGEFGAYQFTQPTWDTLSKKHGVNVPLDQASLEQQNEVAYKQIKQWKDSGYNPGQIASMWNSGKPDAYLDPAYKGVNKSGAHYDVPAYAKSVATAYQQLKQGQAVGPDPANPSSVNSTANQPQEGLGAKLADFAFPILKDVGADFAGTSDKSALQQAGDLALSAMWFVPGLGEAGGAVKGALAAAKIAPKAAELAGKIAGSAVTKGALTGYGVDVASNLSQGKTGGEAFAPGLGTVTGGVLGKVGGAIAKRAAVTPATRLEDQTNRLKTLQKAFTQNSTNANVELGTKATNPIETLEQYGLTKDLNTSGSKVNAEALTNVSHTGSIDNLIETNSGQASQLVESLPGEVPIAELQKSVEDAIASNPLIRDAGKVDTALAEVNRRFASFQKSFGDKVPWTVVDNIRSAMNREWNPEFIDTAGTIGNVMRDYLYHGSSANEAIRSLMRNETELIKARNFVNKLHGTSVPGGQLGKYFAQLLGGIAGSSAGAVGGPVGAILGPIVGAGVASKGMDLLHSRYFKPLGSGTAGLLNRAAKSTVGQAAKKAILRGVAGQ